MGLMSPMGLMWSILQCHNTAHRAAVTHMTSPHDKARTTKPARQSPHDKARAPQAQAPNTEHSSNRHPLTARHANFLTRRVDSQRLDMLNF